MMVFGMGVIFAGYTVASYGWVLLRGWDIPLREWISPLHPYQWPGGGAAPPTIPGSQLFPTGVSAAQDASTTA